MKNNFQAEAWELAISYFEGDGEGRLCLAPVNREERYLLKCEGRNGTWISEGCKFILDQYQDKQPFSEAAARQSPLSIPKQCFTKWAIDKLTCTCKSWASNATRDQQCDMDRRSHRGVALEAQDGSTMPFILATMSQKQYCQSWKKTQGREQSIEQNPRFWL